MYAVFEVERWVENTGDVEENGNRVSQIKVRMLSSCIGYTKLLKKKVWRKKPIR